MKQGLTEIVFIMDRSGSMSGLEADTIGGFNGTIEKQKDEDGEALVSTILFNDTSKVLHDRVNLKTIEPMTKKQYHVGGSTALMDAMGDAIHHIGNVHKYAREEDRPEKTIFIITTDGYENSSQKYSATKVRQMVEHQKQKYGWEFIFLGANIDAVETARAYGIEESRAATFINDTDGIDVMCKAQSTFISRVRNNDNLTVCDCWKEAVVEDLNRRGRRNPKF